jgi:uncharacterized RmlC-like cupin family protein
MIVKQFLVGTVLAATASTVWAFGIRPNNNGCRLMGKPTRPSLSSRTTTRLTMSAVGQTRDAKFFRRYQSTGVLSKVTASKAAEEKGRCRTLGAAERKGTYETLGKFEVAGQGAVGFKLQLTDKGYLEMRLLSSLNSGLTCQLRDDGWHLEAYNGTGKGETYFHADEKLLEENRGRSQTFWISVDKAKRFIDPANETSASYRIIRVGTGEYLLKALQEFEWHVDDSTWETYGLGNLTSYAIDDPISNVEEDVDVIKSKYPVVMDLAPVIRGHDALTMEELDSGSAISIAALSPECQYLYATMAGNSIQLNTQNFSDFSAAIDHSINDKNGICYKKLLTKATEFSSDPHATTYDARQQYLRVTLGPSKGDSSGVPFVMEIWPAGCYSPIHNHGNQNAIIKVLQGSLTTYFYKSLEKHDQTPYDKVVVAAGDVTWLDDRQFQTHRLFNHNTNTACVTIQCYMYNNDDDLHYEYFDYLNDKNCTEKFTPNSDWDFIDFKSQLRDEWEAYKKKAAPEEDIQPIPASA